MPTRYTKPGQISTTARQFFQNQTGRLAVMRSAHATAANVYPMARAYVVSSAGARIVAGVDASASSINPLHRHASVADHEETPRPTWRDRRAAA